MKNRRYSFTCKDQCFVSTEQLNLVLGGEMQSSMYENLKKLSISYDSDEENLAMARTIIQMIVFEIVLYAIVKII